MRTGLGGALGAGLLVGIAPAAAAAGRWLLAAAVIAALATACTAASIAELRATNHGGSGLGVLREQLGVLPARIAAVTALGGRVLAVAVVADAAGRYLTPANPLAGAFVVLVVAGVAELLGARMPERALTAVGVPLVAAVLLVVVGALFAIPPALVPVPAAAGTMAGSDDWTGLLAATGFTVFAFLGTERAAGRRQTPTTHLVAVPMAVVLVLGALLAVAGGALHQLGGVRLALFGVPLRGALVAADASALDQVLAVGAAIAALLVLHGLFREIGAMVGELAQDRELPGRLATARVPVGLGVLLVAGVLAYLVATTEAALTAAMAVASSLCVLGWAFTNSAARLIPDARRFWPKRVPCFGLGLSVLISVVTALDHPIPVVGVLAAGTALLTGYSALRSWRARTVPAPPSG